jgi:hypothetical protein
MLASRTSCLNVGPRSFFKRDETETRQYPVPLLRTSVNVGRIDHVEILFAGFGVRSAGVRFAFDHR